MRPPIQKFDTKNSTYERPNQKWIEGDQTQGCRPRLNGDRWVCTRLASQGGSCELGPNPDGSCCHAGIEAQPLPSLRNKRGQLVRWTVALTIGLLLLLIAGSYGNQFISPGDLTAQHAEISDCAGCHSADETKPAGWLHSAFTAYNEMSDSKNCLSCHKMGENAFKPHNQTPISIAEMTARSEKSVKMTAVPATVAISQALFDIRQNPDGDVTCRTCHVEHQGRKFELTDITNSCQSCHVAKFDSFAEGHPEFTQYPFERSTRIIFDHTSHSDKHFWDKSGNMIKDAPTQCGDCHSTDAAGENMLVADFDQTCASCHLDQTRGEARSGAKGMSVFVLPGLDLETLRDRNIGIGHWPEDADGEITAFTRLLLSENAEFNSAMKTLGRMDLLDLEEATDAQLAAVKTLAWSVKTLVNDWVANGVMGFKDRLQNVAGREMNITEATALSGLMPADVLKVAQKKWWPVLNKEMALYNSGQEVPFPDIVNEETVEVVPTNSPQFEGTSTSDDDGEIDTDDDEEIATDDDDGEIDTDDDEEIATDDDGEIDTDGEDDEIASDDSDDEIGTDDDEIGTDDDEIGTDDDEEDDVAGAEEEEVPAMSDDEWVAAGGWYQQEFSLDYRSTGHADDFLKSWLDLAAHLKDKPEAKAVFADLSDPQALGQCVKCHSVDVVDDAVPTVNWAPYKKAMNSRSFTRFSHQPHFSMISEKGCRDCHIVNKKADYLGSYKDKNPVNFVGNFDFVSPQKCATCHEQEKAPAECSTCHNYHVGDFDRSVAPTNMVTDDMQATMKAVHKKAE